MYVCLFVHCMCACGMSASASSRPSVKRKPLVCSSRGRQKASSSRLADAFPVCVECEHPGPGFPPPRLPVVSLPRRLSAAAAKPQGKHRPPEPSSCFLRKPQILRRRLHIHLPERSSRSSSAKETSSPAFAGSSCPQPWAFRILLQTSGNRPSSWRPHSRVRDRIELESGVLCLC